MHLSGEPQSGADSGLINLTPREVVECLIRFADHMPCYEGRTLSCPLLGVLERAFPFEHRPAGIAILSEFGENRREIDLPVPERTEAAGAVDPIGIGSIHTGAAGRTEFGILHMEGPDPVMVD